MVIADERNLGELERTDARKRATVIVDNLKMRGGATLSNAHVEVTSWRGALATLIASGQSPTNKLFSLALGALFLIWYALAVSGYDFSGSSPIWEAGLRWLHVLSGIMWIGLLYYFNFVQIPNMPKVPDEQKPAVSKVIAPAASDYPEADPELLVPGSLVFQPTPGPVDLRDYRNWWTWMPGAQWRHPEGPDSTLHGRELHPVTHVAHRDAVTYAEWAGKQLPTEAHWERAARGGLDGKIFCWGDEFAPRGKMMANTWQGEFPWDNQLLDG